ncbi:tRNA uridine-5-carboxymethylaminomethyl(34) synthesis GTPase MnmE [Sphingomonas sp. HDW15A]|uniref:tRNA uridine-5-carboxymethylaminomethyl(34) synthesis GTPase MnmE n=1 Tax=Sphingomonas sp. HDW15A TaxID=2714942 RepID=UPI00140DBCFE|nr:tRNA uridine-5-carboxymethylaminomethyl(34) synthesis GTPase MnmE [Sphingomonas sp. HDW15A]QIK96962.1 tRNA uridine-5-carboxymethylaminomethyl(34) synthesis GTPase MnmE [Sphingomonas sp. HDW15A]
MHSGDTICALSSGRPPAAVAVIRCSGPGALKSAEAIAGKLPPDRHASLKRLKDPKSGDVIDDALIVVFSGPSSSTGEDVVEYQCHGGRAVIDRLLTVLLAQPGVRLAEPGEFTRRAFANGRIDLTEAEGLADLLEAETEAQRKSALFAAEGGFRRQVEDWQEAVTSLSARAEAAIDYVGEEDETALDMARLRREAEVLAIELGDWLDKPRAERLKEGIRVVAGGPPNAGKSSLINVLCGAERAIVTPIEGTTRDVIEVPIIHGGVPFLLIDTAGVRETNDPVEQIGVARAEFEAARADILLWLGPDALDHPAGIWVFPRADERGRGSEPRGALAVSALTGRGLEELWKRIHALAAALLPGEDPAIINRRQAQCLAECRAELSRLEGTDDIVVIAHHLSLARTALDRLTGRAGIEHMLDSLFGRFCLGK